MNDAGKLKELKSYIQKVFKDAGTPLSFSCNCDDYTRQIIGDALGDKNVLSGSTKMVIVTTFNNTKVVIKIPFNSFMESSSGYNNFNTNYIAYLPLTRSFSWNHCERERQLYDLAKEKDVHYFFLPSTLITTDKEYPIYIQQYCKSFFESEKEYIPIAEKENLLSIIKECGLRKRCHIQWLSIAARQYSIDKVIDFLKFVEEQGISDLNYDNYGFIHSSPIIYDYAGFGDNLDMLSN